MCTIDPFANWTTILVIKMLATKTLEGIIFNENHVRKIIRLKYFKVSRTRLISSYTVNCDLLKCFNSGILPQNWKNDMSSSSLKEDVKIL